MFTPSDSLGSTTHADASFLPSSSLASITMHESEENINNSVSLSLSSSPPSSKFTPSDSLGSTMFVDASFLPSSSLAPISAHKNGDDTNNPESISLSPSSRSFNPSGSLGKAHFVSSFIPFNGLSGSEFTPSAGFESSTNDLDELPTLDITALDRPAPLAASVYDQSPSDYGTIKARTFDGKPLHYRRRTRTALSVTRASNTRHKRVNALLDVPIHRLLDTLASERANVMDTDLGPQPSQVSSTRSPESLWVDMYKPRRFADLMGNDRVNRNVMAWVKQWDWCVFGTGKKKRALDENSFGDVDDEYRRPREKILLLSGPPGLGKTTLAHVIAYQAGYEVMEINASDARSGSIVDDRIRPALESGSAVGSTKPVLVVIDEIDGATGAGDNSSSFVHKLVQLATSVPRKGRSNNKKNVVRPILRPIICICNDINASALAKLRPHTYQVRMNRPADVHTVQRLREVCKLEGLTADARALSTLVGVTQGDLRGCLNTLQFIKLRNQEVTEPIIRRATMNMKETDSSVMTVVNNLFAPLSKRRVKELDLTETQESKYVNRLAREIDGSGRETYIAIGCFAHYITRKKHDVNFDSFEKANEWLLHYDYFSSYMYGQDGDFSLNGYLPYMLVGFYPLFQERGAPKVERDQADWECLQRTRINEEIYKTLARCLRAASLHTKGNFRHFASSPILETEFAPYINRIISPPLRPVNSQVIKPQERALLTRLVDIMASLELQFLQEREEDGQLVYRLEPPIDVFMTYDNKRAADIALSRYAVRHLVAQEVDAKLISKRAEAIEKTSGTKSSSSLFGSNKSNKRAAEGDLDGQSSNKRPRNTEVIDIADKPPTDFFGRLITVSADHKSNKDFKPISKKGFSIFYKFAEGNSAAVRRPAKISAFL